MSRPRGPRRLQRLTVGVLCAGIATSFLAFFLARASVVREDRLLLQHDASEASLVLSPYVSQRQPSLGGIASAVRPGGVDPGTWQAAAAAAAATVGASGVALVHAQGGQLAVLASEGTLHGQLTASEGEQLAAALAGGHTPFDAVVGSGTSRWLAELLALPGPAAGDGLYVELPAPSPPVVSLSSFPGHPFADMAAAVYIGHEVPADLVLTTTRRLPLRGERAVALVPQGAAESSSPAVISDRVGSVSSPGHILLVMVATGDLAGALTTGTPWLLLGGLLAATLVVTALFEVSGRRRLRAVSTARALAERNALLDAAIDERRRSDARFAAMVRSSSDLTTVVGADGKVLYQSPASTRLLGARPEEIVGCDFARLVHAEDVIAWHRALHSVQHEEGVERSGAWRLLRADGGSVPVETRLTNLLHDPAVGGVVLNSRDVSDRVRLETELRHQAFHDVLTGLANRALFQDRLEHAVARLSRTGGAISVLFLDIDDFKAVNDSRGHAAGDDLLRAVAERLSDTVRSGDTLARLGGDEFAVLLEGGDPALASRTAERILDALRRPLSFAGGETGIRASIGVVSSADPSVSCEDLLREADIAMYAAKSAGKGRCETFHPGLHHQVIQRLQLETDLARALERGELGVVYQPIVELSSGEVNGVEALMRWHHPQRGTVMPAEFIPVAESTGLIVPMGRWLLSQACYDVRHLQQRAQRGDLHLAVNLSARQLDDPDLVGDVSGALQESGLSPSLLTLEITESVFMAHPARSVPVLEALKGLGVKLSIDDFGTGYSSLAYLQRLPVDELKIDRTFVVAATEGDAPSLLETIVRLADDFGLETVAEGIETEQQMRRLRAAGCHLAQGFLFARPADAAQVQRILAARETGIRSLEPVRAPAPGAAEAQAAG